MSRIDQIRSRLQKNPEIFPDIISGLVRPIE